MFGKQVENSILNFSRSKNLVVRDGKVVRLERKNPVTRWFSKVWKKTFDYYNE
jgi:hypothetical protein